MFEGYSLQECAGLGIRSQLHAPGPAALPAPRSSRAGRRCGRGATGLLPPARGRALSPYLVLPAPSLGAGPEGVPRPCPLQVIPRSPPAQMQTWGARARPLLPGSAAAQGGLPGKGRVPEAFVSALPAPRAPDPDQETRPCSWLHKPLASPTSLTPTPRAIGRAQSRTRRRARGQEAITSLVGALSNPQPFRQFL